ncbi:MAG: hypothetical protein WDM87_00760 [Terracidiphilus sp.]
MSTFMRMNEPGWIWSDAVPVSGAASAPFGSLAGAEEGAEERLDMHLIELIVLGARLRE